MSPALRWFLYLALLPLGAIAAAAALVGTVVVLAYPQLPTLEVLTDYQPKIPLRVYTADGYLIGEFGEERRALVRIEDVPAVMKQAILAAEDERFYTHGGVDTLGVLRATYSNFIGGGRRQGASTITMQVARNFFLSTEKTLTRKLYEAMLAFKIEHNLSKDEILQLYINQIYLGQRAYGFSSAAQIYYGKPLKDINIAEAAMLAGLPKAPSSYNPVANPKRAKLRQLYVLRRMHELGSITSEQLAEAHNTVLTIKRDGNNFAVHAEFVAEMARQIAYERFQDNIYTDGLSVVTTITKADQEAAYNSLRKAVMDYDRRQGYRGAEAYINLQEAPAELDEFLAEALEEHADSDKLLAAVVLDAHPSGVRAFLRNGENININGDGLKFAARMLDENAAPNKRIRRGAVIRVMRDAKNQWQITQIPEVEAAFVAASPIDGTIRALVGGFDFNRNKFNHVTQAWRQPGSSFKPFIYSAALEKGYSPASVIQDEPVVISAIQTGSKAWEPKNYDGKYDGPMTMRTALAKSKNMVSIRLLQSIGAQYAQDYIARFGYDANKHPPYLTMALGAGSVTPWQQLTGYSIFANGGYKITPFIVSKIVDEKGKILAETQPLVAGNESLRVIDARNAYLMDSMMHDVVRRGTATRAMSLKRGDLAGKTGTTNDYIDAWFCGYQPTVVGIAWIGHDQPKRLGRGETGGSTALPMWIGFMEQALQGVSESYQEPPEDLIPVTTTDAEGKPKATEYLYRENLPPEPARGAINTPGHPPPTPSAPSAPSTPAASSPEQQQPPAPVQDAQPKPVKKN